MHFLPQQLTKTSLAPKLHVFFFKENNLSFSGEKNGVAVLRCTTLVASYSMTTTR